MKEIQASKTVFDALETNNLTLIAVMKIFASLFQ